MKCTICNEEITTSYRTNRWKQATHSYHDIHCCASCSRFVKPSDICLSDGRHICEFCAPAIVKSQQQIEWVEQQVRPILAQNGIKNLPANIPLEIVTTSGMAKIQHRREINPMQLGLTLTKGIFGLLMRSMSHHIYILEGLHKILFAGTLAHEYLHVWQNEHSIKLPPPRCEGFCNLGSFVIYRSIGNELAHFLYEQLRDSPDPIYGDGFREVKAIYDNAGGKCLMRTLNILTN